MIGIALALLQTSAWTARPESITVGDTVLLEHRFAVQPGAHARLLPLEPTDAVEPLRPAALVTGDGVLAVRYTVAVFRPGRIPIVMPQLEIQYADGRAVMLRGDTAWVQVGSVLPAQDTLFDPRPSLAPVARRQRRVWPLLLFTTLAVVLITAWGVRRRWARPRPAWAPVAQDAAVSVPAARWAAAGEPRAVAATAADGLRDRIAEALPSAGRHLSVQQCIEVAARERPEWPVRELGDVLHALERARFAPAVSDDVLALGERADALAGALDGGDA